MIVVDNSVLISALVGAGRHGEACAERLRGEIIAAPALLDVEAANSLRGLVRGGRVSAEVASHALAALAEMPIQRVVHQRLLPRIWELRDNLTAYDAAYVAVAERLGSTLVTGDARMFRAPGLECIVELIG